MILRHSLVIAAQLAVAIHVAAQIEPDRFEDADDTPAGATPIAINSIQSGRTVFPELDPDFFTFTLNEPTPLLLESTDGVGPFTYVRDGFVQFPDIPEYELNNVPYILDNFDPGTYIGRVLGALAATPSSISVLPHYALHIRDARLPDRFESDDDFASANYIAYQGAPQTHNFHTSTDEDWVFFIPNKIDEPGFEDKRLFRIPIGSNVDISAELYVLENDEILFLREVTDTFGTSTLNPHFIRLRNMSQGEPEQTYYRVWVADAASADGPGPFLGSITGFVTKTGTDEPIPSAEVTALLGFSARTQTDTIGGYTFPALPNGSVEVGVEADGFVGAMTNIVIADGEIRFVSFELDQIYDDTDVNQDGTTNAIDIQSVINVVLGIASNAADVNDDGVVNSVDIQFVINTVLGIS